MTVSFVIFKRNGALMAWMGVKTRVVTRLDECRALWEEFSKEGAVFDIWDYRAAFFDHKYHDLHFIVGTENEKDVFLLALWKRKSESHYEWFGGEFFEDNKLMVKSDNYIPELVKHIPENVWLPYTQSRLGDFVKSEVTESFFIDLRKYNHSVDEYFAAFNKKHRKNLLRDLRILQEKNLEVVRNNMDDFDRLIELSTRRFGDSSFLAYEEFAAGLKKMLKVALERDELEMLSIKVNGVTEASEAAILCNGTYTVLLGGNNLEVSNIGKFLTVEHIKNAIEKKANIVDFLADDCGWKTMWHMEKRLWSDFSRD
jgi:CelD/BcsL family acetyltransferase involved in cellulose biosynthesis